MSASDDLENVETFLEIDKNKYDVKCVRCDSLILTHAKATYEEKEFILPKMHAKNSGPEDESDRLRHFWLVDDMFTFDNVGFSNTVDGIKYLICADCEVGPIGWHDTNAKKAFYIALSRVKHS